MQGYHFALPGHPVAARFQGTPFFGAGVVVKQAALQQLGRVFALQIVDAAMRRIAVQAAVMRDAFAGIGEFRQYFRNRPSVACPYQAAVLAQAVGGFGPMVACGKHF